MIALCGMDGSKGRRLFSLGLLLLIVQSYHYAPLASGQTQVGVSLMLRGEVLSSESFVDIDDIMYTDRGVTDLPSNRNPRDEALKCVTDLVDCCGTESGTVRRTMRGDWYLPNGSRVGFDTRFNRGFKANRGPNEVIEGSQVYGSVRLYRSYTPIERGRFRCELPNAANPSVNQTIYAIILQFGFRFNLEHVTISPSTGSTNTTAGQTGYSLTCSSTLFDPSRLPSDVPSPNFQWSFNGGASLPSSVTAIPTIMSSSNSTSETYASMLQFSSISQCHIGSYTCRLGAGRLANSAMVTVDGATIPLVNISVQITANGNKMVGQIGYSLTCDVTVTGAENPSITYQWTKHNGTDTQIQVGTDRVVSFSPLRLSDAGQYTCQATAVSSPCSITKMDTHYITLQIPAPASVMLSSSVPNPIPPFGSSITLTCTVELSPAVDVPVTVNTVLTRPDGFTRTSTAQPVNMGSVTNYAAAYIISSFGRNNSGIHDCSAHLVSMPTNTYISDSSTLRHSIRVTTGVYLALRGVHITNNSNINIRNIGQTSDNPNGALQCITDNLRCCRENPGYRLGEWYLPSGALVQGISSATAFYRSRGDDGEVSLNRPSSVESPTGLFYCEVPDATNTNQTLCVNIGSVSINIPPGSHIAGESYTLECSAGGSEGTFQWLGPPDGMTPVVESSPRLNIISTATSSQLQFRAAQQSDNGSYSCSVTIDGSDLHSDSVNVVINAPLVSVSLSDGGATPTAGGNSYLLTCSVSGAENLNPTISYRWTKNIGSGQTQVGTNSDTLSFTPLRLSDAASYVCEVTIASNYLTGDVVAMSVNSQDVIIRIPTPSSLTLMSSSSDPYAVVIGSDITLTCTLMLNSEIMGSDNALLMVDAQLSRDGTPLTLTGLTVTGTIFTYTTAVNSFGGSDSGNYTCTATVRPQPSSTYLIGNEMLSTNINIRAASSPPLNVRATQSSSSAPVEVSWSSPTDGANTIPGYRIYYGNGKNVLVPSVTVITSVSLKVDGNYIGQNVSIRSEDDQLYSELVNVSIVNDNNKQCAAAATHSDSCTSEVGIAVGVMIVVLCLVAIAITVIVVLCLWRKKSSSKNKRDFAVSANMAYGEVTLKSVAREVDGGVYENPDKMLRAGQYTGASPAYETIHSSKSETPECVSVEGETH